MSDPEQNVPVRYTPVSHIESMVADGGVGAVCGLADFFFPMVGNIPPEPRHQQLKRSGGCNSALRPIAVDRDLQRSRQGSWLGHVWLLYPDN